MQQNLDDEATLLESNVGPNACIHLMLYQPTSVLDRTRKIVAVENSASDSNSIPLNSVATSPRNQRVESYSQQTMATDMTNNSYKGTIPLKTSMKVRFVDTNSQLAEVTKNNNNITSNSIQINSTTSDISSTNGFDSKLVYNIPYSEAVVVSEQEQTIDSRSPNDLRVSLLCTTNDHNYLCKHSILVRLRLVFNT